MLLDELTENRRNQNLITSYHACSKLCKGSRYWGLLCSNISFCSFRQSPVDRLSVHGGNSTDVLLQRVRDQGINLDRLVLTSASHWLRVKLRHFNHGLSFIEARFPSSGWKESGLLACSLTLHWRRAKRLSKRAIGTEKNALKDCMSQQGNNYP